MRPELTRRLGRGGELDTAPAGAGKRRSFSLTLVSLVASPLATRTDGHRARKIDRQASGQTETQDIGTQIALAPSAGSGTLCFPSPQRLGHPAQG